jgi:hypothetical protein
MRNFNALILLLCMAFSANAQIQTCEFRTYDVAPDYREEVYGVLQRVLLPSSLACQVELLPTGQILINGTPTGHEQVAVVLEEIRRHQAEPTPRVTLQYWVVLGTRMAASGGETPAALDDVLDEVRAVHGPLSFRVLGNATLVTDSGMSGQASGGLRINQMAYVQGTRLQARLAISFFYTRAMPANGQIEVFQSGGGENQGIELNTSMEQGEFVVVGENSITDLLDGQSSVDGTVFYIVHWPTAN